METRENHEVRGPAKTLSSSALIAPPAPKRLQIAQQLRDLASSLSPGDRLPSVSDLECQLGVARKTVVTALSLLQQEGIIDARPRSGTYVAERGRGVIASATTLSPTARNTVAIFAFRPAAYYLACVNQLVIQAGAMGLDVECQYTFGQVEEERVASSLARAPLGALLLSTMTHTPLVESVLKTGHRAILIGEPRVGSVPSVPCVYSDAEQGGRIAVQHLLDLGHRRIAYVHWMPQDANLFERQRWRGHEAALRDAGISGPLPVIGAEQFAVWRSYPEVLRHYMTAPDASTAFVAWSDPEAVALVTALQQAGLRVPGDVSVVGYDNLPEGVEMEPRLTTVDQDMKTMAHRALSLLLTPVSEEASSLLLLSPVSTPRLIRRDSTAPLTA